MYFSLDAGLYIYIRLGAVVLVVVCVTIPGYIPVVVCVSRYLGTSQWCLGAVVPVVVCMSRYLGTSQWCLGAVVPVVVYVTIPGYIPVVPRCSCPSGGVCHDTWVHPSGAWVQLSQWWCMSRYLGTSQWCLGAVVLVVVCVTIPGYIPVVPGCSCPSGGVCHDTWVQWWCVSRYLGTSQWCLGAVVPVVVCMS